MPAKIEFSEEQTAFIVSLYQDHGLSCLDIAGRLGVAKNTIRDRLMRSGVPLSNKIAVITRKAIGRPSARKGATHTAEARAKMSAANKGNKRCAGRKYKPETIEKMRASMLARAPYVRRVVVKKRDVILKNRTVVVKQLSDEEKRKRENLRGVYKRLVRRVFNKSGKRKEIPSEKYLGYSQKELLAHLGERPAGHDLDHIVPVAEFFRMGITDPMIINALENLRWLESKQNRIKSDSVPSNSDEMIDAIVKRVGRAVYELGINV